MGNAACFSNTPALTCTNSTNVWSVTLEVPLRANVSVILYLSAPVAFSFEDPCALSNKLESSLESTKVSVIFRPTLCVPFELYFSNASVCLFTFAKKPLTKNTPLSIENNVPSPTAVEIDESDPPPTFALFVTVRFATLVKTILALPDTLNVPLVAALVTVSPVAKVPVNGITFSSFAAESNLTT